MVTTRADVAQRAGVSPSVVSYVMNDGPRPVSAEARERVNAAIAELHYRPNQLARSLKMARTQTIGLLIPDVANPFFWELASAIEQECFRRGQLLFIGTTSNQPEREQIYLDAIADRQVDGIILISTSADDQTERLLDHPTPVVLLDRMPQGGALTAVQTDNARGAELAVAHLVGVHGSSHIALLAGPPELDSSASRMRGARHAADAAGIELEATAGEFSIDSGYESFSLLARDETGRPLADAVFAFSDAQAIGFIRACRDGGLGVPEDIAVVGFDGTELSRHLTPALTTIQQDPLALARHALDRLTALLGDQPDDTETPTSEDGGMSPHLVLGESCGCSASRRPDERSGGTIRLPDPS